MPSPTAKKTNGHLHLQISAYIRDMIYGGEWAPNSQIPSEYKLMDQFGVSRGTSQKAIETLVEEGLLYQIRGKGTYVASPELSYATGSRFLSFAESLRTQGVDFTTKILRQDIVPANEAISAKLNVPINTLVLRLNRLRRTEQEPILYQESWVNLVECPGLADIDYSKVALFDAMEEASGRKIGYSKTRFSARLIGQERGEILGIDERTPVLHMDMVVCLEDNVAIEWGSVWLPSNKYVLTSVMQRF